MIERVKLHPRPKAVARGITILDCIDDDVLFGRSFKQHESWKAWRAFLATLFGLPLSRDQQKLFRECTGRQHPSASGHNEAWLVIGRRGGKSFVLASIAVYLACFRDWRPYLGPGEFATIPVIATDRTQARVIMRYVKGLLHGSPILKQSIVGETAGSVTLRGRVVIEVHAASFRSTRGYSIVAALLDELAFFRTDDAANPDDEILNALRPGMATIPDAMLLCASSPYARRGALWNAFRKHHAQENDPILVWQAATRTMNFTIPQKIIDQAIEDDPAAAGAEYLAQFRSDVESYITREAVEACISLGVRERAAVSGAGPYSAFVDPSGGSSDSFTLAIAHRQDGIAMLDCIREVKPPFSPESVVAEFAATLNSYRIIAVSGDRYAGEWPREQFRKHGITYEPAIKSKSDLYKDFLPAINSRKVDLLDHPRLLTQLTSLERRTARGGRDSIDHAPGAHDDIANACAGAICKVIGGGQYDATLAWVSGPDDNNTAELVEEWRRMQFQTYIHSGGRVGGHW